MSFTRTLQNNIPKQKHGHWFPLLMHPMNCAEMKEFIIFALHRCSFMVRSNGYLSGQFMVRSDGYLSGQWHYLLSDSILKLYQYIPIHNTSKTIPWMISGRYRQDRVRGQVLVCKVCSYLLRISIHCDDVLLLLANTAWVM